MGFGIGNWRVLSGLIGAWVVVGLVWLGDARGEGQEEAEKLFAELFGVKMKEVARTRGFDDDLALMKQMMGATKTVGDQKALVLLIYEKVYELGRKHPDGFEMAIQAMDLMGTLELTRAGEAMKNIVDVCQRRYSMSRGKEKREHGKALAEAIVTMADDKAGDMKTLGEAIALYRRAVAVAGAARYEKRDAVKVKLDDAVRRQAAGKRLERVKGRLKADPKNANLIEEFFEICVVQMHDLKQAGLYSFLFDAKRKERIGWASKGEKELTAEQVFELGYWYEGLAGKGKGAVKAGHLARCADYLERFLDMYDSKDIKRTKAQITHATVMKDLAILAKRGADAKVSGRSWSKRAAEIEVKGLEGIPLVAGKEKGDWKDLPKLFRKGAVIFGKAAKDGTPTRGVADITVKRSGVMYVVCDYHYQGNSGGGWMETRWTKDQFVKNGWKFVGDLEKNSGNKFPVFMKKVKAGEKYSLRCNKYSPPYPIVVK